MGALLSLRQPPSGQLVDDLGISIFTGAQVHSQVDDFEERAVVSISSCEKGPNILKYGFEAFLWRISSKCTLFHWLLGTSDHASISESPTACCPSPAAEVEPPGVTAR